MLDRIEGELRTELTELYEASSKFTGHEACELTVQCCSQTGEAQERQPEGREVKATNAVPAAAATPPSVSKTVSTATLCYERGATAGLPRAGNSLVNKKLFTT